MSIQDRNRLEELEKKVEKLEALLETLVAALAARKQAESEKNG